MTPGPSVIVFTVLSGMGLGYMALLSTVHVYSGVAALAHWTVGHVFTLGGLLALAFQPGQPRRTLRQGRFGGPGRAVAGALLALAVLAPVALSDWQGLGLPRALGWLGAALALGTVLATGITHAQNRAGPRWSDWLVPALFLGFALAGGCLLAGLRGPSLLALTGLAGLIVLQWRIGDQGLGPSGRAAGTVMGLGDGARFDAAPRGKRPALRETADVVARRHKPALRALILLLVVALPMLAMLALPGRIAPFVAVPLHMLGAFAQRWLFFAQAGPVSGLYAGRG